MSGPATRMKLALAAIAAPWDGRFASGRLAANAVSAEVGLRGITPEQLAAMDAAAEILRLPLAEAESSLPLWPDLGGPEREKAALRQLLDRAVRRRKEGGS